MIVKPSSQFGPQYTNVIELERFESVWIEYNGLTIHVQAGLLALAADIFAQPMANGAEPLASAEAKYPKGIA